MLIRNLALGLVLALATAGLASTVADDASKKDQEQMQGEWTLTKQTRDGKDMPEENLKATRTVKDNTFTIKGESDRGPFTTQGEFKLDASKSPKEIDFTFKTDEGEQTIKAIYELDGDTLKTCYNPTPGAERPKKMESKEDSGIFISVWKKKKAEK
jgi:uncharacterized protein (TIGR03067 family)